ncbi:MAG TPA: YezD family protein [Bacilli bacterium]|nr:YezD family protein [Bacilli bacterium]
MGNRTENIEQSLKKVKEMLEKMNFGSITLIVQDNHVVQIERNEKIRLK